MDIIKKNKKYSIDLFMDILTGLANKEYQRRVWIEGRGPQVDSYEDTVCEFFSEVINIIIYPKNYDISNFQYKLILNLYRKFDLFYKKWGADMPEFFIDTDEWNSITEISKEILILFNYQNDLTSIIDPDEFNQACKKI